jgi:hypothetical protein
MAAILKLGSNGKERQMEEVQTVVMKGRGLVRVILPRVRLWMKVLGAGRMTLWIRQSVLGPVGHRVSLEVSEKVK